jgi:hypothetical protein
MRSHSELIKPDFLSHKKLRKFKIKIKIKIPSSILDLSSLHYCFYTKSRVLGKSKIEEKGEEIKEEKNNNNKCFFFNFPRRKKKKEEKTKKT